MFEQEMSLRRREETSEQPSVSELMEAILEPSVARTEYNLRAIQWFDRVRRMNLGIGERRRMVREIQKQSNATVARVHRTTQKESAERERCREKHEDFVSQWKENFKWMLSIRFSRSEIDGNASIK